MNLYTVRPDFTAEFKAWLAANVGPRYRIVGYSRPQPIIGRQRRLLIAKEARKFHSHAALKATTSLTRSQYQTRRYPKARTFQEKPVFHKYYRRVFTSRSTGPAGPRFYGINLGVPRHAIVVFSVLFDNAADMVMCKMAWHDRSI